MSTDVENSKAVKAAEYERIIQMIPEVIAVRVVLDGEMIREIHVLADNTKHPTQLVKDIESCLSAYGKVHIDRRYISVAQIETDLPDAARFILREISLSITGNEAEVRAELAKKQQKLTGVATGAATSRGRLVLAALAVLNAAGELLPPGIGLFLENIDWVSAGGERAVIAIVSLVNGPQVEHLAGVAYVRRDDTEAAGMAVLAAINRRINLFI
ncbi:MAG TPA: hypothetical protein GXX29_02490 [Firmicutes bacterium]|nr:hypothetical protein [Bacillota bacterium]